MRRSEAMSVYSTEMSKAGQTGCPDANVLAAYVDRQLGDAVVAEVEAHLASCVECAELLAEALSVGEIVAPRLPFHAEPAEETGRWMRRVVRGGAVAAALVAALVLPQVTGPRRDDKLADLAVAAGVRWPVEGRLTGGIPHSSLNAPLAGGQGGAVGDPVRVQLVAGKIREDLDARGTPEQLHSFGLSQLLLGHLEAASVALTAAAREQPLNAAYQSDAAAFYLERARAGRRPDDLPRALAAAERARLADPSMLEGVFNRALALERLSLSAQARQAWTEYLKRDASSPWAAEARSHLEALSNPSTSQWSDVKRRLQRGVDAALADEAVRTHMSAARTFLENELWPAWTEAAERGSETTERGALRAMAGALAQVGDDLLYLNAVEAIDRAANRGPQALRELAAAHRAYSAAAATVAQDRFAEAAPGLTAARSGFAAAQSSFVTLVDFDFARMAFYNGPAGRTAQLLDVLATTAEAKRYPFVAGRVSWMQGLVAFGDGRYADVRVAWESTLATFENVGDAEQIAAAHALLANLHFTLGDSSLAWEHRSQAMKHLEASESTRLRYQLLITAAGQALREGLSETALVLQNEVVLGALADDRPAAIVEALIQRAAISIELGQRPSAQRDLADARERLKSISEAVLRERRESDVLALESELQRSANPAEAARLAARAIDLAEPTKDSPRIASLWLRRAKAEQAAGMRGEAERSVTRGIEVFALDRARLAQAGGASRDDEAWELFEIATRLAIERGEISRAFRFAAAARTRDPLSDLDATDLAERVESQLAADEAVIALNQLDDELLVWLLTPGKVEVVRRPVGRAEGARLVARHRDEIELESMRTTASTALFDELARPLGERLRGVHHLVVLPDAPYYGVAFAGLRDRDRDRFLIEDRSVRVLSDLRPLVNAKPRRITDVSRTAVVDVDLPSTADAAFALWSSAPDRAVVRVAAPIRANNANPSLSSVMFADAPGRRYSGLVLTREIAARDLSRLRLVILPDCTATSDTSEGQGTLGVATAFLAAGVESVVAPLSPIGDDARPELFAGLDRELGVNTSTAAALRSLQRDALRSNGRRLGAWTKLVAYGVGR